MRGEWLCYAGHPVSRHPCGGARCDTCGRHRLDPLRLAEQDGADRVELAAHRVVTMYQRSETMDGRGSVSKRYWRVSPGLVRKAS